MSGDNPSNEKSQSGSVEPTGDTAPEAESESSSTTENGSLISDLIRRRIPQVLAGYLGVTWTLFELLQWMTDRYLISPYLGRVVLFGLLMLIPAVILLTYRHGRPGPDRWTRFERWGTAANVVLALLVLGFAYGDAEFGFMTKTVRAGPTETAGRTAAGDTSAVTVRQVPKEEFRKQISLFYFDKMEDARADTSLRRTVASAIVADLSQDDFIGTRSTSAHDSRLIDHGYEHGMGVPLGLKREIAQWEGSGYIVSGSVGHAGGGFRLTTRLYETETGREISERSFEEKEFFTLIDRATRQLKQDLQLPQSHLKRVTDLPVTQVYTASLEAAKRFAEGGHLEIASDRDQGKTDKLQKAFRSFSGAVELDSTFAHAHMEKGKAALNLGREEKAREALQKARLHDYRLAEPVDYALETIWLTRVKQRPREALQIAKRWTELHPYDPYGWRLKAFDYLLLLEYENALESYQSALEKFPTNKSLQLSVGEFSVAAGNLQSAVRHFESLAGKYPEMTGLYDWLGVVRWKMGNLKAAEKAFEKSDRLEEEGESDLTASLYQAAGRFERAIAILKQSTRESEASRADGYRLLHHYVFTGRVDKANLVFDSLWTADTGAPGFHKFSLSNKACMYRLNGVDIGGDNRPISHMRKIGPRYRDKTPRFKILFRKGLGICLAATDSLEAARRQLADADSIVTNTIPYYRLSMHLDFSIGRVYEELGSYRKAADHYERFLEVHARHGSSVMWTMGRPRLRLALAHQKAGNAGKARKTYQRAVDLYPSHPRLNYHYGQFLVKQGKTEQAQSHIRRALKGWKEADSSFAPKHRAQAILDSLGTGVV